MYARAHVCVCVCVCVCVHAHGCSVPVCVQVFMMQYVFTLVSVRSTYVPTLMITIHAGGSRYIDDIHHI